MIKKALIFIGIVAILTYVFYAYDVYSNKNNLPTQDLVQNQEPLNSASLEPKEELHIKKPTNVKGIYMSSWVAGTKSFRDKLVSLVNDTELNAIVIDFKDSGGIVSVPADNTASPDRVRAGSRRAVDLPLFIEELHSHGIYTVARIAVFEDPIYSKNNPSVAVLKKDGTLWENRRGLSWVDASSAEFHKYILDLSIEAYEMGFDEINLDYIRFPTDGSSDRVFPVSLDTPKKTVINNFLSFMHRELSSRNIPMSIDVFGQIVSTNDDMGIGQYYEDALVNTDAIAPMIYPSHFYPGYKNLLSPESSPYETIRLSMIDAIKRKDAINSTTELRPWIQDFGLAVPYGPDMVKAQIKALSDLGIESYLVWDPKNRYTKEAFALEPNN
jgi:hypothetical protein